MRGTLAKREVAPRSDRKVGASFYLTRDPPNTVWYHSAMSDPLLRAVTELIAAAERWVDAGSARPRGILEIELASAVACYRIVRGKLPAVASSFDPDEPPTKPDRKR